MWAMIILVMTLLPPQSMPSLSVWELLSFDSFVHALVFAILIFMMIVGFCKQHTYMRLRMKAIRMSLIISATFGILIEVLQWAMMAGRHGDIIDVISNTAGCLAGILLFYIIYRW
ncbi:MAG TPA: VanZ family protein [Adhaeribacter sp.]|nr:VanZ family protein [Adhaeribacter sp.]